MRLIESILGRIAERQYTVGIVGLGYVGLPLALTACRAGFHVLGYDIDSRRAQLLQRGETGIRHIPRDQLAEAIAAVGAIDPAICRQEACRRFSAHRTIEAYMRLYEDLARRERLVA